MLQILHISEYPITQFVFHHSVPLMKVKVNKTSLVKMVRDMKEWLREIPNEWLTDSDPLAEDEVSVMTIITYLIEKIPIIYINYIVTVFRKACPAIFQRFYQQSCFNFVYCLFFHLCLLLINIFCRPQFGMTLAVNVMSLR